MEEKLIETKSPLGYIVVCSQKTWEKHIIVNHPEMTGNEVSVAKTINNPDVIYKSSWNPDSHVYHAIIPESSYPHLFTRVVINVNENKTGVVSTALFTKAIGGIDEEGLLYVKPKR
jgi:hypothetical protein